MASATEREVSEGSFHSLAFCLEELDLPPKLASQNPSVRGELSRGGCHVLRSAAREGPEARRV